MRTELEKQAVELRKAAIAKLKDLGADVATEMDPKIAAAFDFVDAVLEEISWVPLDSTNLKAIRYHTEVKQLDIKFHNGSVYEYADIPEGIFATIKVVDSAGRYFNTSIKPFFECVKRIKD